MRRHQFEMRSVLKGTTVDDVWGQIGTWTGVNYELGPLLSMSAPPSYEQLSSIPADGKSHFTLPILLFGIVPFDWHKFAFLSVDAPRGFHERSSNLNTSEWVHKRSLNQVEGGVEVVDECSFLPRLSLMGPLIETIFKWVFKRRHQRLREAFA